MTWKSSILEALLRWDTWLVIAGNALPLMGVAWLGWDATTLVILYWLETAIIGFWTIARLIAAPPAAIAPIQGLVSRGGEQLSGLFMGLFVVLHAGIFMFVHFQFLRALLPGAWSTHLGSPADFLFGFVIPTGIWIPLAGMFVVRGIIAGSEIRADAPLGHAIGAFYARILLMQFTIILGGFLALAVGGPAMLALLILLKTLVDLSMDYIAHNVKFAARKAGGQTPE